MEIVNNTQQHTSKIIGLTGGIGSGKSTVAKILEKMGYSVYYSDDRAKEIVYEDPHKQKIIKLLGEKSYENGVYNRNWIAEQIFNDDEKRLALNQIIHPAVKKDFEEWVIQQKSKLGFKETALLFELNLDENCDKSILVTADESVRIRRVMERDGKTKEEVLQIISKQMPESDKVKRADFTVLNNGEKEELYQLIEEIINQIL